jgi:outer membrane PBP1 activator LpoA protein
MQRLLSFLLLALACVAAPSSQGADGAPVVLRSIVAQGAGGNGACLALILPLDSENYGAMAEAVRAGFLAANRGAGDESRFSSVNVYPTGDAVEEALAAYQKAIADGCSMVVGPLTRNAATLLARSDVVSVPTLVLNVPEVEDARLPARMYSFSLRVEAEAQQVARYARDEGKTAVTVASRAPLARRMQQAFAEEWVAQGGVLAADVALPAGKSVFTELRDEVDNYHPDVVFLATDARRARLVRPYLSGYAVYGTSQVNGYRDGAAARNLDMDGVRFVDMPWLLQPDHPAVMVYPRAEANYSLDMERLYALGIDACRLANELAAGRVRSGFSLDGVTGKVSLAPLRQFVRELPLAEFRDGTPKLVKSADLQ